MNRWTQKIDDEYIIPEHGFECLQEHEIITKLGKLEDLEEKLGIDLVTLFELIGKTIYPIVDSFYYYCLRSDPVNADEDILDYPEERKITLFDGDAFVYCKYDDFRMYPVSELNKTWFLTREEAEKALKDMEGEQ